MRWWLLILVFVLACACARARAVVPLSLVVQLSLLWLLLWFWLFFFFWDCGIARTVFGGPRPSAGSRLVAVRASLRCGTARTASR